MTDLALLVAGGGGQLGMDLYHRVRETLGDGSTLYAPTSAELDITDQAAVGAAVTRLAEEAAEHGRRPVVINAAAYTAVDAAEADESTAMRVNRDGPARLAAACTALDVPLIHVSTDYVFPGDAERPYEPSDPTGPRSAYGRTKLAGERAVLDICPRAWVVRTAGVYGAWGGNFVKTMAKLEANRETLSVVSDQAMSPTWAGDLAIGLLELAMRIADGSEPARRVLHATNDGQTTWFEFARAIFVELGADPERVRPCGTEEFPRPAPRPAFSVLSANSWISEGLTPLQPWRAGLAEAFAQHEDAFRPA
ncbi:dTDP-4-dehydrorhamnose reductase [Actinoalloteichus hymeniacidonis]|uniref:dTDP-4-dehydrorhamnose reductase n=1 Tax=Actinoalloteichus hymeniacidonis TaxID=340345 RepID=A0AAC9HUZ6_9PSEU|nr:dTDP-4-dehydrorhamnose reductase [Actinoalloteichus hymeniacidonis]AOS65466.1 dTDP-4-dehydrorhamnose reductase [Actinoalloteichus hymeniacidonis]MBB5906447.1 dTDP-4-dehydrorhamnose reductase [Actinoalloteichus hymeniacidonis]